MTNGDYVCNNGALADVHTNRCAYYLSNSQNKHKKGFCDAPSSGTATDKTNSAAWNQRKWYNNQVDCETAGMEWKEISHDDILNGEGVQCEERAKRCCHEFRHRF